MEEKRERIAADAGGSDRVQICCADRTAPLEWSAELVLPDYRSEISRLMWVRPTFSPPAAFFGNGRVEMGGSACFEVLYAGPDGELYSICETRDYNFSLPMDLTGGREQGLFLTVELLPDTVIGRVAAPRKLSLRARLHARVRAYAEKDFSPRTEGEAGVLYLCEPTESAFIAGGVGETLELQDELQLGSEGEVRVIAARGAVFLPEVHATHGGVRVRGEAVLTVLCRRESMEGEEVPPFTMHCRIPFEEEVAVADATADCPARAVGVAGEVSAVVEEGKLLLTVPVTLQVETAGEQPVFYAKDLFLPGKSAACRTATEVLTPVKYCGNRHFSVGEDMAFEACGIPAGATVIDAFAEIEPETPVTEKGKTVLTGTLRCRVLYLAGEEYGVGEALLPFRHVADGCYDEVAADCQVPVCRVSGGRERVRVDAEVQLSMRGAVRTPVTVVSEAAFAPMPAVARGDMELCYPAPGESLWQIAKRYGIAPAALAEANGLAADGIGEPLIGVRYLTIP